jgi:hypothetical protein
MKEIVIPDLLSTFTPTNSFPINADVRDFFLKESIGSMVSADTKPSKNTRKSTKTKKKDKNVPNEIEFRDDSGEIVDVSTMNVDNTNSNNDAQLNLRFVEIKSIKNRNHDKNRSKKDQHQDNTVGRIIKPSLVQDKNATASVNETIIERFDETQFMNTHFVMNACPCNSTVKNGKYYAYDKYGCIIRVDCKDKRNNPYGWTFNDAHEPVSIYEKDIENEVDRTSLIEFMKNKFPTAFTQRGVSYKLYKLCYDDIEL